MAAIFQMTFLSVLFLMKVYKFQSKFHLNLFPSVNWQYFSTGSENGSVPSWQQAIIWYNDR